MIRPSSDKESARRMEVVQRNTETLLKAVLATCEKEGIPLHKLGVEFDKQTFTKFKLNFRYMGYTVPLLQLEFLDFSV